MSMLPFGKFRSLLLSALACHSYLLISYLYTEFLLAYSILNLITALSVTTLLNHYLPQFLLTFQSQEHACRILHITRLPQEDLKLP